MKGIEVNGTIIAAHADYKFTVRCDGGHEAQVYLSGKLVKHRIIVVCGDVVRCELSPYDPKMGRITFRL